MNDTTSAGDPPAPSTVYRDRLATGELWFQQCEDCDSPVFHPRVLCTTCGSQNLAWHRSQGRGRVHATTIVRSRSGAKNIVLIDLDEGFRMMSRIEDVPAEQVTIGAPVTFGVLHDEGEPVAVFYEAEQSR